MPQGHTLAVVPAHHFDQLRLGWDGVFDLASLGNGLSPTWIA